MPAKHFFRSPSPPLDDTVPAERTYRIPSNSTTAYQEGRTPQKRYDENETILIPHSHAFDRPAWTGDILLARTSFSCRTCKKDLLPPPRQTDCPTDRTRSSSDNIRDARFDLSVDLTDLR